MMPRNLRPTGPERPPLQLPAYDWSESQRRFLDAAIRYAQDVRDWVLEKEADRMEQAMRD